MPLPVDNFSSWKWCPIHVG